MVGDVDGWIINECMDGRIKWMNECIDWQIDGCMDARMDRSKDRRMDGWKDAWWMQVDE